MVGSDGRDADFFDQATVDNKGLMKTENKQELGRRLALVALEKTYGKKIESGKQ